MLEQSCTVPGRLCSEELHSTPDPMQDATTDFNPVSSVGRDRDDLVVLRSKVTIPPITDHHVERARVRPLLDDELNRLVLVISPAGYGKSALLAEWANSSPDLVSWLRLDEGDDDQAIFVRYLVASVAAVAPEAAREANELAAEGSSPRAIATALVGAIAELDDPIVTVLDDFHRISAEDVMRLCTYILDALPRSWRWIIGSRSEPPLGLARRRANLSLRTVSAEQLRFEDDEAHRLLVDGLEIQATTELASAVNDRAAGWAAGLCLAGLAARESPGDREGALLRYSGQDRHLGAYFAEEVFARLPPRLKEFLLDTSVLYVLTPDSCWAVSDIEDATDLLREAANRRLFVTRLDQDRPDVYQYHDLFSEWLQAELEARAPGRGDLLRQRAASWCADRGLVAQAVRYSLDAGDWRTAIELIREHGYGFIERGMFRTVLTWITALPESELQSAPALAVLAGDAAVNSGELTQLAQFAAVALGADTSTAGGKAIRLGGLVLNWFTILAVGTLAEMQTCSAEMERLAESVDVVNPRHHGEDVGRAFGLTAISSFFSADYSRALELARRAGRAPGTRFASLVPAGLEALVRFAMGEIAEAEQLARGSLAWADKFDEPPIGAILGALVLLWTGNHDDVRRASAIVNKVASRARLAQGPIFEALCDAEVASRGGNHRRAAEAIEYARRTAGELQEPRFVQKLLQIQAERVLPSTHAPDLAAITERELDVLRLLRTDLTRSEIARALGISSETVKSHSSSIYRKLAVSSRSEAVERARRFDLV